MKGRWRGTSLLSLRGYPARTDGLRNGHRSRWIQLRSPFPCNIKWNWINKDLTHVMRQTDLIKTSSTRASSGKGTGCNNWANPGRQSSNSELLLKSELESTSMSNDHRTNQWISSYSLRRLDNGQVTFHVPYVAVVVVVAIVVGLLPIGIQLVFARSVGCRRLFVRHLWSRWLANKRRLFSQFVVLDGMIGLDVDPVGWITLASPSVFIDTENSRQANGYQIGQNAGVGTGGSFAVGTKKNVGNEMIIQLGQYFAAWRTYFWTNSRTAWGPSLWA